MRSIKDLKNIKGKRIILRADFNVPLKKDKVVDSFRIQKTFPTILFLQKKKAKIIIISHLGDDGHTSLLPIAKILQKKIKNFSFIKEGILSNETENKINLLKNGEVVLLENLRQEDGEKKNSPSFARALSRYGDIYVNDAFSVCHREHASVFGITKYLPGYAGFQLINEVENLSQVFKPAHPFLFILGGSKFETKIPIIRKFIHVADNVFIGGAIANDFLKAKGYEIGNSLIDEKNFQIPLILKAKNLVLPDDVVVSNGQKSRIAKVEEVKTNETIVDVGPETISKLQKMVEKSSFILWNGPLGKYEDGFGGSTEKLLKIIFKNKAKSVIGGGDTVTLISKLKLESKLGFISTGGGAMLDFLAKGTLPGIRVLK